MRLDSGISRDHSTRPALWRTAGLWVTSRRVRPVLLLAAGLMSIFSLQRVLLMLLKRPVLGDLPDEAILRLFLVGFRQDLRVLAYLIFPLAPVVSLLPNKMFSRPWLKSLVALYVTGVLIFAATVCLADALFFMHGNSRLNWQVPSYIGDGEIALHLWANYPVILILLGVILLVIAAFALARRYCSAGQRPVGPTWTRLTYGAVLTTLVALGAHWPATGTSSSSSQAYFCSNSLVSQLAFNPVTTGGSAMRDYITEDDAKPERYTLLELPDAFDAAHNALRQKHTVFASAASNPLWRTVRSGRAPRPMNVVIIIMESFAGRHVGALGNSPSQTPFFDALVNKGTYFSHMYASGSRTSRGLAAVLCGFPDLGGKSILACTRAQGTFQSLFGIFADRGYETSFFYGGDAGFDNMRDFFGSVGLQRMIDIQDMPVDAWRTDWGVGDHVVFDQADRQYRQAEAPFFSVVLTLTNHNPHTTPPGCIDPPADNTPEAMAVHSLRYADWAMERFFAEAAHSEYFDNTLFVLVADHGVNFAPTRLVDVEGYRVPCLLYAPGLAELAGRRIEVPCSQTDVGATVLAALGGEFSHGMFGRDLLTISEDDEGLALLRKDRCMALVRGKMALIEMPERKAMLFRQEPGGELTELAPAAYPGHTSDMHRTAMGFYQAARELYLSKSYGLPPS